MLNRQLLFESPDSDVPRDSIARVMEVSGIDPDGGLDSIYKDVQKLWIQRDAAFRADIGSESGNDDELSGKVFSMVEDIGLIDAIIPEDHDGNSTLVAVGGAKIPALTMRLDCFEDSIVSGDEFALGSTRPLDDEELKALRDLGYDDNQLKFMTTEADALVAMIHARNLDLRTLVTPSVYDGQRNAFRNANLGETINTLANRLGRDLGGVDVFQLFYTQPFVLSGALQAAQVLHAPHIDVQIATPAISDGMRKNYLAMLDETGKALRIMIDMIRAGVETYGDVSLD